MEQKLDEAGETSATIDPLIGTVLGEYKILERIGSGGMGVVYRGVHIQIEKPVAIKVLQPSHGGSAGAKERASLLAEARAAAAVRHRGIVDVFGFGELPDNRPYLVMELLEGKPLDEVIREGPVPLRRGLTILSEVLEALAAAHACGIIHRDLKPNNVLVVTPSRGREYVKLLDFGIAKRHDVGAVVAGTTSSMIVGTPAYIAPEQARCELVSARTDLYSVGCMAFEVLSGVRPFYASNPMDLVCKHLTEPPPRLSEKQRDLPRELDDLVFALMQKSPAERPASAEAVRRKIEHVLSELPPDTNETAIADVRDRPIRPPDTLSAAPTALRERFDTPRPPSTRSSPRRVPTAAIVLLALSAVVGAAVWLLWKPTPPAPIPPTTQAPPAVVPPAAEPPAAAPPAVTPPAATPPAVASPVPAPPAVTKRPAKEKRPAKTERPTTTAATRSALKARLARLQKTLPAGADDMRSQLLRQLRYRADRDAPEDLRAVEQDIDTWEQMYGQ